MRVRSPMRKYHDFQKAGLLNNLYYTPVLKWFIFTSYHLFYIRRYERSKVLRFILLNVAAGVEIIQNTLGTSFEGSMDLRSFSGVV